MIKKKLLSIAVIASITAASVIPTFALDNNGATSDSSKTTIEKKHGKEKFKGNRELTPAELKENAIKLGIDVTGLSDQDIAVKIKETIKAKHQLTPTQLKEKAAKLDIDVTGLSDKDIATKIKEAKHGSKDFKNMK